MHWRMIRKMIQVIDGSNLPAAPDVSAKAFEKTIILAKAVNLLILKNLADLRLKRQRQQ